MKRHKMRAQSLPHSQSLVRPLVENLRAYVPGEQPKIKGLIKLNTNENPYPPSPKVIEAVKAAVDDRLRLYPNPTADLVRERLARLHGCGIENIIVGNGSDELLALATRGFVEPSVRGKAANSRSLIQFFTPSYSLYPVLAAIHGAEVNPVPLAEDYSILIGTPQMPPCGADLRSAGSRNLRFRGRPPISEQSSGISERTRKTWKSDAALTFITTPNAPSGRGYSTAELDALCQSHQGVIILDEAYVDFARENAMSLALKYPHVIVARTFSKAYSLCFQRIGYFVGHPALIAALHKIRDSYNVNGLGQVAAAATLADLSYYRTNFKRVIATRQRLTDELTGFGFTVAHSQTNFIFCKPPQFPAETWLQRLRDKKVLVRWFKQPEIKDFLRITIGTDAEADALLRAIRKIL